MVSVAVGPIVYVPVTPVGLGVVETAYVFVLSAVGQSPSSALTFALAGRVLFTGTDIIGLPWLLKAMLQHGYWCPDDGRTTHTGVAANPKTSGYTSAADDRIS